MGISPTRKVKRRVGAPGKLDHLSGLAARAALVAVDYPGHTPVFPLLAEGRDGKIDLLGGREVGLGECGHGRLLVVRGSLRP
jgi:hypothetical protein